MTSKWRRFARAVSVLGVSAAVVVGGSGSAMAIPPDVAIVRIKNFGEIGASTGFYESFNTYAYRHPAVVRVVGYFRSHTATKVTLTKLKICYTNAADRNVLISPAITNSGGTFDKDWVADSYAPGQCRVYSYTKTLTKQSDGNMMQVLAKIMSKDNSRWVTIVGFDR